MDIRHNHGSDVYVVRACHHEDGNDLVALGGTHSVQVLLVTPTSCKPIANFHIGCRITAIAWSSKATSPSRTDEWVIELTAASSDYGLYVLSKRHDDDEVIFPFGGGLSGHHGKINDMTFCGGHSEDSSRYVATVSDDKMLMVWDLTPSLTIFSPASPGLETDPSQSRPPPTAYPIAFPRPLASVCSHPSTSKEFLVADARGSIFLTDWRSDPDENDEQAGSSWRWRNASVIELVEPRAVAGMSTKWSASASWRRDNPDFVGAIYGSRFALWDLSKLQGGKPTVTGSTFTEGGDRFRWCPTYPEFFAVSSNSPQKGAIIHVHNTDYVPMEPTAVLTIAPRPLFVRDFDFLATPGVPKIAAAVGREVVLFQIGVES